jgi:hypothetical protein
MSQVERKFPEFCADFFGRNGVRAEIELQPRRQNGLALAKIGKKDR